MKMLQLQTLLLLIGTVLSTTTVIPNTNLCACSQIQYQSDCLAVRLPNSNSSLPATTCNWLPNPNAIGTQAKGTCVISSGPVVSAPVVTYCSVISVDNCSSTNGCALPDGKNCQAFTGCSAYVFTTNTACQAVSTQCTTDGTQCTTKKPCSYYSSTISNCGLYSASSGNGTCKVSGSSCVDQTCADAPTNLITDLSCNQFLTGCVSNGAGCTDTHVSCASRTGTATTCSTFIGLVPSEGQCKYSGTGTACAARICSDAPTTLTTNAQCMAFLPSCLYTTGKGCVSVAQTCSQLNFSLGCSGLVNTSGVACTNNTSQNPPSTCREIQCSDNITSTTNTGCNMNGLTGCVTNGAGCVDSASFLCTAYAGTNAQCNAFFGANGPCKGIALNATTSQACVAKACSDAPQTLNTNKACAAIQTGCVTTGYGCAQNLSTCQSYTPTPSTPCDGYQGSDGPCTLVTGASVCSVRTCSGASTTTVSGVVTNTNSGCQSWFPYISTLLPGCVTNGTTCVLAGTCSALSQTSCTGFNNCSFTKSCVQNNLCSGYYIQSQCISNVGQFGRPCVWGSGTCSPTPCPSSSSTTITDAACQGSGVNATPGCYYQGTGQTCIDGIGASCAQFSGDNSFTANKGCAMIYGGKCAPAKANQGSASVNTCVDRTCALFYQTTPAGTTNQQCGTWLTGCLSNGYQGCVSPTVDCTNYFGTQSTCNNIFANGVQCFNSSSATASTACVIKTADLIPQTTANLIWNDSQCNSAFPGSVSSQVAIATVGTGGVCVSNTSPCSAFSGSLSFCMSLANLKSGKCTQSQICSQKTQSICDNLSGTSISSCKAQQYNCIWASGMNSGTKCIFHASCASYIGTAVSCNSLTDGFGLTCGSNTNSEAGCTYANYCQDYNTGLSTTAKTYCATLKDAFGITCTAITDTDQICSYPSTATQYIVKAPSCTAPQILINGTCTTITSSTDCTTLTGPFFTNAYNCSSTLSKCTWASGPSCTLASTITICTSYHLPGDVVPSSAVAGNAYCTQFSGAKGKCQYIGATPLTATTCAEPVDCGQYTRTTTGQALSVSVCTQFTNANNQICTSDGVTCTTWSLRCSQTVAPSTISLASAQYCSQNITLDGICSIPSGGYCGPAKTKCEDYLTTGLNAADSATLCKDYFLASGIRCSYSGSGSACQNRTCSDQGLTITTCSTYIGSTCGWNTTTNTCSATRACSDGGITASMCPTYKGTQCQWNGTACVDSQPTCSSYASTSFAACSLLYDFTGRQCGYGGGSTCANFQCTQIPIAGSVSHASCQASNPGCTAFVTTNTCVNIQTSCYKYQVISPNDCQSMKDKQGIWCSNASSAYGQCTYSTAASSTLTTEAKCLVNPAYTWNGSACLGTSTIVPRCQGIPAIGADQAAQSTYCKSLTSNINLGTSCILDQYSPNCIETVISPSTLNTIPIPNCSAASPGVSGTGCEAFSSGCQSPTNCGSITCSMATSTVATSTAACAAYQTGCIWNGTTGCVADTTPCANLKGTVTTCATFVGNKIPCYQPVTTAISPESALACADVKCANAPSTIRTDAGCESWLPSKYSSKYDGKTTIGPNLSCVWTGTTGCTIPQPCSAFIGNATTCPIFTATDGPCKAGTGSNCTPAICTDAPNTITTDSDCAKYANSSLQCLTTGQGCIAKAQFSCTSIVNSDSCAASAFGGANTNICSWLPTCVASVTSCTDPFLSNATLCVTTPIAGAKCAWNTITGACQNLSCSLLPNSLTTHAACSSQLSTCTTTGAGCITLGTCSSYTSAGKTTCLTANNQELSTNPQITKCIWEANACRVAKCTDNTTATTNIACNTNGLTNCVTTGAGCVTAGTFSCSQLTTASACLVDGLKNPCLWISGSCQQYSSCTSLAGTTHQACQSIASSNGQTTGCTSNGINCIALNSCTNYTNSASCVISNQKQTCGWLPANSKGNNNPQCVVFGACTDATGTTNAACQLYGGSCISNGTSCQQIYNCATYTQYACLNNQGTDGTCFWSTNQCTTNGTTCIPRSTCSSYTSQQGCVQGTDGQCFWVAPAATAPNATIGSCRVQQCNDSILTTNSACSSAIITTPAQTTIANGVTTNTPATYLSCVSNGTNCIAKSTCGSYTNQQSCQGGGTDGDCAFTPGTNASTPTIGTCQKFSSCSIANSDQVACNKASDRCFWNIGSGTNTSCTPITCSQASSSGSCKPIPTFDKSTYTICAPVSSTNSTCIPQDGSASPSSSCFSGSLGQHTWNDTASTCTECSSVASTINNTIGTNNGSNSTTYGLIIASSFLIYGAILGIY